MIKKISVLLISIIFITFNAFAQKNDNQPLFTVHHLAISVNNIDTMRHFYSDVLGAKIVKEVGDGQNKYLRIDPNGFLIDMLQVKGSYPQPSQSLSFKDHMNAQGYRHLVLVATNIDKAYNILKTRGVQFYNDGSLNDKNAPKHLLFKDPEGNVLGLSDVDK